MTVKLVLKSLALAAAASTALLAAPAQAQRALVCGGRADAVGDRCKGVVHAVDRSGWGALQTRRRA